MRFGGIVLTLVFTVSACAGETEPLEPDPTASTDPTVSSSPAPTPTATLPAMPDQAREDSAEGAAAFVDHWVDLVNYAARTGNVVPLEKIGPRCASCAKFTSALSKPRASSTRPTRDIWTVKSLEPVESRVLAEVSVIEGTDVRQYSMVFEVTSRPFEVIDVRRLGAS